MGPNICFGFNDARPVFVSAGAADKNGSNQISGKLFSITLVEWITKFSQTRCMFPGRDHVKNILGKVINGKKVDLLF